MKWNLHLVLTKTFIWDVLTNKNNSWKHYSSNYRHILLKSTILKKKIRTKNCLSNTRNNYIFAVIIILKIYNDVQIKMHHPLPSQYLHEAWIYDLWLWDYFLAIKWSIFSDLQNNKYLIYCHFLFIDAKLNHVPIKAKKLSQEKTKQYK